MCVCVCKAPWQQQVQPKQYPIWEFFKIQTHVSSTHAHLLPLRQPLHRELSNCLRGFKLALRRQPRDYSASTKIHICCRSGKKKTNPAALPLASHLHLLISDFLRAALRGWEGKCVCVCGGGCLLQLPLTMFPFIDLSQAVTSYQGFAKFSAALSPGPNWSLPAANWLDRSDMSKSISQLNGAGRWRAVIAAAARCLQAVTLWWDWAQSVSPKLAAFLEHPRFYSWLDVHQWLSVFVVCVRADIWGPGPRWNEWQLFWSRSRSSQKKKKSSPRRRGRTITWPDLPGERTRTCSACMQGMSTERCHGNAEAMTRCDKQHTVCVHCGFQVTSQLMWSEPGKASG